MHSGKRGRERAGCETDRLRSKRVEKSRIGRKNKAIKTGEAKGEFSPLKFTGDGYLTRLPVPGRASAIPHARKKETQTDEGKKKGDEKRRKEQL